MIQKKFAVDHLDQNFYDYLVERLAQYINMNEVSKNSWKVPVVTGYFGPVPGGIMNSVGRGYTDLTAALVSVALEAAELQIWKEVDGIFTGDPRKVKNARLLSSVTPDEAAELTYYGSEVIHPFTMEQVIKARIPIRIKNTFNPTGPGTMILPKGYNSDDMIDRDSPTQNGRPPLVINSHKHPTAVTIKEHAIVLNVRSNKKSVSHGFFASVFNTLDR